MASVDGAKFGQTASDDMPNQCDPCKYDNQEKPASHFCQNCNEFLCLECSTSHKKLTISRNHTTLPVDQLSEQTSSHNTSCVILCEGCHTVPVSYYCEQHHSVVCQTCKFVRHRKCKSEFVKERSKSYKKVNLDEVTKNAKDVEDQLDQLLCQRTEDLRKLTLLKENCVKEIKEFRQEINVLLDMQEEKNMNELDECENMERKEIERDISTLTNTKQLLNTDSQLLQDVRKTTMESNMFSADVKVSNHLKDFKIMLQDIAQETKPPLLTFKRNDQLYDMMNKANELGTTLSNENGWKSNTKLFPDMTVKSCSQVDIKLPYESNTPWISGCDFLPDGQILLCDNKNIEVKLLTNSFTMEATIDLKDRPCDVSVINSNDAIVTLPLSTSLQFIQIKPSLKLGRILQLDKKCWGIQVADENIYITLHNFPGEGEVRILDLDGNCKRRIGASQDGSFMFTWPSYLTLSVTSGRIYVSDTEKNTATCMESDGSVVYQYRSKDMERPRGLCLDAADNLIMVSEKSYHVQVISSSGQKVRNLLTVGGGDILPLFVKYRSKDNTLFVGCMNTNNMFVYHLA